MGNPRAVRPSIEAAASAGAGSHMLKACRAGTSQLPSVMVSLGAVSNERRTQTDPHRDTSGASLTGEAALVSRCLRRSSSHGGMCTHDFVGAILR